MQSQRAETLTWDAHSRETFGRNFVAASSKGLGKGSSLRELNDAVFDAMVRGKGGTVRVGMGSKLYGFVGGWVPNGLVSWMMGVRKTRDDARGFEFGRSLITASEDGSRSTSPGSPGSIGRGGFGGSDYISVHGKESED